MTDLYDIVVVGGGIHGVGVAQAGAAHGYKTLLLEKNMLAGGTSSRSSKLIHGGLRYLESWQLGLVRDSLREREILLRIAPHLVTLKPFYIPIYRETTRKPWKIRSGLSLYSLLGNLSRNSRFRTVPRKQWRTLDGLRMQGLKAIFQYRDGQTNDQLLTEAVMRSATSLGAEMACPADFVGAEYSDHRFRVTYSQSGKTHHCQCRALVNAGGPWANTVLSRIKPETSQVNVELVQGAHIVLEQPAPNGIFYLESPRDQRAVFVMPWHQWTLVGTTETHYQGDPAKVHALDTEIKYLLETVGRYFPKYSRNVSDSSAGLRVLPSGDGPAFDKPRERILHTDSAIPGLVTIYGGKLTGYRATAEKVIALLQPQLPASESIADTATLVLPTS